MESKSLIHDAAWAMAHDIVEVFAGLLREEEHRDAVIEVYVRAKAGIRRYERKVDRMFKRLRPGRN